MGSRALLPCVAWIASAAPALALALAQAPMPPAAEAVEEADARGPAPHEVLVVTPCGDCATPVVNSPAAVSVISSAQIATAPDRSWGELLRTVPGVHAVRYSAREYEVTSRQATSNLSSSQLALIDGRSLYQDFLGVTLWDFVTTEPSDVEQIEVVRGPASAVWGANALSGVVNIVTRSPRSAEGSTLALTAGSFDRDAGSTLGTGEGTTYGFSASLSRVLGPRVAARASAGYSKSDPLPRPTGTLPLVQHPLDPRGKPVGGGKLPADSGEPGGLMNRGTTQPRVDVRVDQQTSAGRLSYSAGIAGSDGLAYTGIGPFALEPGSFLGYARTAYTHGRFSAGAFYNVFDSRAPNLLTLDPAGEPVRLEVRAQTWDLSSGYSRPIGGWGVLTVGGNARHSAYSLTLAPDADDRTDAGVYVQQEAFVSGRGDSEWRIAAGGRLDKLGSLDHLVFSPRLSLTWKPGPDHALRASVNQAFRAPTVVDQSLDLYRGYPTRVGDAEFVLAVRGVGNADLREESLTAWEIGYIGTLSNHTTLGVNAFLNDTLDNINFTTNRDGYDQWTLQNLDEYPGPVPPAVRALAALGVLPRTGSMYRNLGPIRQKGVEAFVEHRFGDGLSGYVNYSWLADPRPLAAAEPFPALEITVPPRNRVNAGIHWTGALVMGQLSLNHADPAFWTDVLPHEYDGWSPGYTMFNASLGLRWSEGRVVTLLRGTNLTNTEVRQHVYGDIVKRCVWLEARFQF